MCRRVGQGIVHRAAIFENIYRYFPRVNSFMKQAFPIKCPCRNSRLSHGSSESERRHSTSYYKSKMGHESHFMLSSLPAFVTIIHNLKMYCFYCLIELLYFFTGSKGVNGFQQNSSSSPKILIKTTETRNSTRFSTR